VSGSSGPVLHTSLIRYYSIDLLRKRSKQSTSPSDVSSTKICSSRPGVIVQQEFNSVDVVVDVVKGVGSDLTGGRVPQIDTAASNGCQ
jgi:hypothetical protein